MNLFINKISCFTVNILIVLLPAMLFAQSQQDLRINEVLPVNKSGITTNKGEHAPWIEIFNTAYNKVNLGGLYITDDPSDLTKHLIPKGNSITVIPQQSHLILWADGDVTQGILHTSFKLGKSKFVALVESNGKTIIDSVTLPLLKSDTAYARVKDGESPWKATTVTTPGFQNYTGNQISTGEQFVKHDPVGIGMAIIAMSVVFTALILLYLVFKNIAKLYSLDLKKARLIKKGKIEEAAVIKEDTPGEVAAAISLALHLYASQLHDEENTILTITRASRTYSPWSSKIYGLSQNGRKPIVK